MLRRCVWSRNIKNRCSIHIYDISSLRVNIFSSDKKRYVLLRRYFIRDSPIGAEPKVKIKQLFLVVSWYRVLVTCTVQGPTKSGQNVTFRCNPTVSTPIQTTSYLETFTPTYWAFLGREWKTTNPFNYQLIRLVVNFRGDTTKYTDKACHTKRLMYCVPVNISCHRILFHWKTVFAGESESFLLTNFNFVFS